MKFHVITLFPDSIRAYVEASILGRAIRDKKISVSFYNPRSYTQDKHQRVDRRPYGGGPGMVVEAPATLKAVDAAKRKSKNPKIIFFSPSGKLFDAAYAKKLAKSKRDLVLIAGHYEGMDARVKSILKAESVSVGNYVLTGGELPAATIIDATVRHIPGILGNEVSVEEERVASPDVYTRPEIFTYKGKKYRVPKVLLSGNHANIEAWKQGRIKKVGGHN